MDDELRRHLGSLLLLAGVLLVAAGLLLRWGGFGWFGHLPGDIRYEGRDVRFWFPITSMLLVSAVLTLIVNLLRRWW